MRLESISYKEYEGTDQEWELRALKLFERNLIVGRNSSGKTRCLNIIAGLANHLSGKSKPGLDADISATFSDGDDIYTYHLKYSENEVTDEEVTKNGETLLSRAATGFGTIYFDGTKSSLSFQIKPNTVAAFARRDTLQHPFLDVLGTWADQVRYYPFSGDLGKQSIAIFIPAGGQPPDDRNAGQTVALYRQAVKEFGQDFTDQLIADLARLDYEVVNVNLGAPTSVRIEGEGISTLQIREAGCRATIDQFSMSNGLYRVLAVLINTGIALRRGSATTILIDDVGEGLDYERSVRFIELIHERCVNSKIQLIMTTNDKFVMNAVPLDEWTVLHRNQQIVAGMNHKNTPQPFEDFKFTGLSNFGFFEMNNAQPAMLEKDSH